MSPLELACQRGAIFLRAKILGPNVTKLSNGLFGVALALASDIGAAQAKECFAGTISCNTAALAVLSFKLARDCSAVFMIDPAKAAEFQNAMSALRQGPLAVISPDAYSDEIHPRPVELCNKQGRSILAGRVPGVFVIVRPEARSTLGK